MISDLSILDEITEILEDDGFNQTESWIFDGYGYSVTLENDNKEKLPIYTEIELTDEDIKEIEEEIVNNIDISELNESVQKSITESFEKEGYKQNNYWEYEPDGDVFWASFIDYNLDGVVVSSFRLTKEDLKSGVKI